MPLAPIFSFTGHGLIPFYATIPERRSVSLPPSVSYPAGTILGEVVGVNAVYTLTLGAQSSGTYTLTVNSQTTAAIAYNANAAAIQTALALLPGLAAPAVQQLAISGTPTGGTFTLSYGGQTTTPLNYNATAAQVQAALQALSSIGPGNITASGGALPGTAVTLTFAGELAGEAQPAAIEATSSLTGGTNPAITVTIINPGGVAGGNVAVTGTGPWTLTFQGAEGDQPVTATGNFASLTTPGNASLTSATTGVLGTRGQYKAYAAGGTDGSQTPKAILEFDCQTDAAGLIYMGQGGASPALGVGTSRLSCPAFVRGSFRCENLNGLDANCVNPAVSGWRLVQGTVEQGELLLP